MSQLTAGSTVSQGVPFPSLKYAYLIIRAELPLPFIINRGFGAFSLRKAQRTLPFGVRVELVPLHRYSFPGTKSRPFCKHNPWIVLPQTVRILPAGGMQKSNLPYRNCSKPNIRKEPYKLKRIEQTKLL